ncbi:hypothetical protein AC578_10740 [Pseudocercospora eumusae]|uniref:Uncharacterized protein n=1 Tax=Pseudocercospora eumusae TaxID=321146 RepID=A0A139H4E2_9PEZI|nr:hypothetical protein AC578_10740 [Pseudocercospora eumusae]
MPSSTLSMSDSSSFDIFEAAQEIFKWHELVQSHEQPAASSRRFVRPYVPPRAKRQEIGFLHLPDNVRTRIYELAVYDHDRTAVFLPRGLPRKVEPDVDDVDLTMTALTKYPGRLDTDIARENDHLWHWTILYRPTASDDDASAGTWVEGDADMHVAALNSLRLPSELIADMTDEDVLERLERLDDASDEEGEKDEFGSITLVEPSENQLPSDSSLPRYMNQIDHDDADLEQESASDESTSSSEANAPRKYCIYDLFASDEIQSEDVCECPDCFNGHQCDSGRCDEPDCRRCCDHPRYFEELQDMDRNVFDLVDHGDADELERFDSEESIGMLYEPKEPGILLVCKEIRAQSLPIYFTRNAFSWRFAWTDYRRSCRRFKHWLKSVGPDHVRLITKITFQGRHRVEEGIEFSADIDLLDEYPYFETNVYIEDDGQELCTIAETINREMAAYLWLMAQHERTRPMFSIGHLCELANMFVKGMHRDSGGCVLEEAAETKLILSPLF